LLLVFERFTLCCHTIICLSCLLCLSVLSVMVVYCGQTVGWIKVKLGMQVGLGPAHIVLNGDPAHASQKGYSPPFSAHACCGQTATWIKMPLGMEVGLGLGHIALDGTKLPPQRGTAALPSFGPMSILWPNGRPSQLLLNR